MNLKNILKQKIIDDVFSIYKSNWSILVYDSEAALIIQSLFTKTDFLSYSIMTSNLIEEDRPEWDFPVIYFVSCSKQISKIINSEYKANKYSSFQVCSLIPPEGLNELIRSKIVYLNLAVEEERLFLCSPNNIISLANVLNTKFNVNYIESARDVAHTIQSSLQGLDRSNLFDASLLIFDRSVDLFTPLLYFFTFKSILSEINFTDSNDLLFDELKNKHLAEVSDVLQFHIKKLNRNMERLGKDNVDAAALSKMVLDAPKNIEIKDSIQKYSKCLEECFKKLDYLKEYIEASQLLVTEFDVNGKRIRKGLDFFFKFIGSTKLAFEDKLRLFYLLKAKGISFTKSEIEILKSFRFSDEDIGLKLNLKNQILRGGIGRYKYDISRYEPIVVDLIREFVEGHSRLKQFEAAPVRINSLRKSTMIFCESKAMKRKIVIYMNNGITVEETQIAYSISEKLGVDILIGSNKILNADEFIKDLRKEFQKAGLDE